MKRIKLLAAAACAAIFASAEVPKDYYYDCEGLCGAGLLSSLRSVVGPHTTISYDGLWEVFNYSDIDDQGYLIDMYSTKGWTPGEERCGSAKNVGDCVNREHSFPKSWFDNKAPMSSDLFHLYPTDGRVNNQRSNYPYGECSGGTTLPSSGGVRALGRLGSSTFSGYSGTVFEPDDEYKGDFARTYFYMAAAYNDKISTWSSPMLDGTAYPAFSSWTVEMLLKWHRQDPVSDKELQRNEVGYQYQHNRNPFIDYPELAEHVWGNKKSTGWAPADAVPAIINPVDGTTIDMGVLAVGKAHSVSVALRARALESAVSVSATGGYTVGASTVSAAAANSGTTITVTLPATAAKGEHTGALTVSCGSLASTVTLHAELTDNCSLRCTGVSDESFEISWVNIHGDDALYTVHVQCVANGALITEEAVEAAEGALTINGLEPSTSYKVWLTTPGGEESPIFVTTAAPVPWITVTPESALDFRTTEGVPSEPVECTVEADNIDGNIVVAVSEDSFEVSVDHTAWSGRVDLLPGEDRFYVRAAATVSGRFTATLTVSDLSGEAECDEELTSTVTSLTNFLEDFENEVCGSYYTGEHQGNAALWQFTDVGIWASDVAHSGANAARLGNTATSCIAMAEDLPWEISHVQFYAHKWVGSDKEAVIELEGSSDQGATWTAVKTFTLSDNSADYLLCEADASVAAPSRIRLRQTAGKRALIDDIALTPRSSAVSVAVEDADRDSRWSAWSVNGELVVSSHDPELQIGVYGLDGTTLYSGAVGAGLLRLSPAPGLYIVASDTRGRRVLVR